MKQVEACDSCKRKHIKEYKADHQEEYTYIVMRRPKPVRNAKRKREI